MDNNEKGKIGFRALVFLVMGGMFGGAIFSLSGITMYNAGPASILTWLIAAFIMLFYGMFCAELSMYYPKSGGVYVFPARAFGKRVGFLAAWGYINAQICAIAFSAINVGIYFCVGFPALANVQIFIGIAVIALCLFMNCIKLSTAGNVMNILVCALIITLVLYIGAAFFTGKYDFKMLNPFFSQGKLGITGFLQSVPLASVGYGAIVSVAFLVSDIKNPNKTIPKAVPIAIGCVAIIYVLIISATLGLISAQYLEDNPDMKYIPLFAAAFSKLSYIPWLPKVISIAAVLAQITQMLVCVTLVSKTIKASADDGILPRWFRKTNKYDAPANAAIVVSIISAIVSLFTEYGSAIVSMGSYFSVVIYIVIILTLFKTRKKEIFISENFHAPGKMIMPSVILVVIILCNLSTILGGTWIIWVYTIIWYLLGLVIYNCSKAGKSVNRL